MPITSTIITASAAENVVRVPPREEILETLEPGHPRLHVSPGDFVQLKSRIGEDATLAKWYAEVRRRADRICQDRPTVCP